MRRDAVRPGTNQAWRASLQRASSELLDGHPVIGKGNIRAGLFTVFTGRRLVVTSGGFRLGHGRKTPARRDRFPVRIA